MKGNHNDFVDAWINVFKMWKLERIFNMALEEKKVIKAMKVLKDYSSHHRGGCNNCLLKKNNACDGVIASVPRYWDIPKWTPILTNDERVVLSNLDPVFKWIACDLDGSIWAFANKPKKRADGYVWEDNSIIANLSMFHEIFKWIEWEDEEPIFIPDLLHG